MRKVSLFYKRRKNRKKKFLDEVTTARVFASQRGYPLLLSDFFTKDVSLHYINYQKFAYFFVLKNFDNFGLCFFVTPWLSATYACILFLFLVYLFISFSQFPLHHTWRNKILHIFLGWLQTYKHDIMFVYLHVCM
mgnify:CR=1 FL=1